MAAARFVIFWIHWTTKCWQSFWARSPYWKPMAHNCGNLIPNHWETAFLNCVPSKAAILRAFYIFS